MKTTMLAMIGALVTALMLGQASAARAAERAGTDFALIIGVNRSVDRDVAPLRYADDDAARYRDLFQALGARTYLLATIDENTARLHPRAAQEAVPPRSSQLREVVGRLAADIDRARRAGQVTNLYVLYAGHGNVDGDTGYITLEDTRLTGRDLTREVVDRVPADRTHLIVDACDSVFLVLERGPGGRRRPFHGFSDLGALLGNRRDVGVLLSTSSARESHEWAAFQAGVFSHEVRSGLFGPADADGNGIVTYPEIAAFVKRANDAIPNERYRPEVFWRPPRGDAALVDLRGALARRVEIPATDHGRYFLEDPQGVRLADFHNGRSLPLRVIRPGQAPHLYLHRARDHREFVLQADAPVLRTSEMVAVEPHVSARSAAHEAFTALFALPFEQATVDAVQAAGPPELPTVVETPDRGESLLARPWRAVGAGLLVGAAAGVAAGTLNVLSARALRDSVDRSNFPQKQVDETNQKIERNNRLARIAFGLAGAAAVGGALLLLWPEAPVNVGAAPTPDGTGGQLSFSRRF